MESARMQIAGVVLGDAIAEPSGCEANNASAHRYAGNRPHSGRLRTPVRVMDTNCQSGLQVAASVEIARRLSPVDTAAACALC